MENLLESRVFYRSFYFFHIMHFSRIQRLTYLAKTPLLLIIVIYYKFDTMHDIPIFLDSNCAIT